MNKLLKSVVESGLATIVALTGTALIQPNQQSETEVRYEAEGATADDVFNYALQFEGMKREEFREEGWEPNYSAWCAWYASQMLIDCNVPFPVSDFDLRIWVADILYGYLNEGRYIHTASETKGFTSQGGGKVVSADMLRECQDVNYTPQHGDLLFFDWNYDGLPDHIGFVDYVADDGRVHTLEGNPGDMPDTETKVSRLSQSKAFIIGYAKPAYITAVPKPEGDVPPSDETSRPSESAAPKTLTITFDAGENAFCDEQQREITWGTCTYDFPTPNKVGGGEFVGWFDGDTEVTCDSLITGDITLHARWKNADAAVIPTEQMVTPDSERDSPIEEVIVVERQDYSSPRYIDTAPAPILVESVNLSRYAKTLSTAGNSTAFTLTAEAYPSNAEGRTIRFESSNVNVAQVDCNTGYVRAICDGSCKIVAYAENGVSASCEVIVSTQYTTRSETVPVTTYKEVPESYNMECFVGRMAVGKVRQFFNYDISNMLASLNLDEVYGMWHHEHTFPASEVDNAARIYRGQQQGGSQNGTNACDATGYSMWYGDAYYIFFIKSINYRTEESISYQTRTTQIPVEYN